MIAIFFGGKFAVGRMGNPMRISVRIADRKVREDIPSSARFSLLPDNP